MTSRERTRLSMHHPLNASQARRARGRATRPVVEPLEAKCALLAATLPQDVNPQPLAPEAITMVGGLVDFLARDQDGFDVLWASDGTTAGTAPLAEVRDLTGPFPSGTPEKSSHLRARRSSSPPTRPLIRMRSAGSEPPDRPGLGDCRLPRRRRGGRPPGADRGRGSPVLPVPVRERHRRRPVRERRDGAGDAPPRHPRMDRVAVDLSGGAGQFDHPGRHRRGARRGTLEFRRDGRWDAPRRRSRPRADGVGADRLQGDRRKANRHFSATRRREHHVYYVTDGIGRRHGQAPFDSVSADDAVGSAGKAFFATQAFAPALYASDGTPGGTIALPVSMAGTSTVYIRDLTDAGSRLFFTVKDVSRLRTELLDERTGRPRGRTRSPRSTPRAPAIRRPSRASWSPAWGGSTARCSSPRGTRPSAASFGAATGRRPAPARWPTCSRARTVRTPRTSRPSGPGCILRPATPRGTTSSGPPTARHRHRPRRDPASNT